MRRTNKLRLRPTEEQERALLNLCEMSAVLWNKLNYIRRQSFFTLLKLKGEGSLPPHIHKISPPRYWKDRKTVKKKLMTIIRNDVYRIEKEGKKKWLVLPKGLRVGVTGSIRWRGKQGRLEIFYDDLTGRWYAHQNVEVDQPRHTISPTSAKAFVDLGVMNIITAWIEGERQCVAFSGKPLLSDWWYWSRKISEHQSELKRVNDRNTSKRLRKLYRKRQRRFRHAINTIIHRFVKLCLEKGVGEIIVGDITHIRDNNDKGGKINAIIHNFWSFRYIIKRLKTTAENFGISVRVVGESGTSSKCPWCNSKNVRRHKRLFKCLSCGIEAHRDVVGALNIALLHGEGFNRVLAHPAVLRLQTSPPAILALQGGEDVKNEYSTAASNIQRHAPLFLMQSPHTFRR